MSQPAWRGGLQGLQLGQLLVSFQRFERPTAARLWSAPPSLGALPVLPGHKDFVLPLGDDEAFWIGVLGTEGPAELSIVGERGLDATRYTFLVSQGSLTVIAGFPRPDGSCDAFARRQLKELTFKLLTARARVHVVDPTTFTRLTGVVPPKAPGAAAGYKGWRLP